MAKATATPTPIPKRETCAASGTLPKGTPDARAGARVPCHACGGSVAVRKDGKLAKHTRERATAPKPTKLDGDTAGAANGAQPAASAEQLTRDQKRRLARALLAAAGDLVDQGGNAPELADVTADAAAQQLGRWLRWVSGADRDDVWDDRLARWQA